MDQELTFGGENITIFKVEGDDAILQCKGYKCFLSDLQSFAQETHPTLAYMKRKVNSEHQLYRDNGNVILGCLSETEAAFINTLKNIERRCQKIRETSLQLR